MRPSSRKAQPSHVDQKPSHRKTNVRAASNVSAARAIEIREFHELGVRVRALANGVNVEAVARTLAANEDLSFDRAKKAARFASLCGERDLERICNLCVSYVDWPLSVNHIQQVLRIRDRKERYRWLERAARDRLSAVELGRAIKRSAGQVEIGKLPNASKTRLGGPKLKKPKDLLDTLEQVIGRSDDWLKRFDLRWKDAACWPPRIGVGDSDPGELATQLKVARVRLASLRSAAEDLEVRLAGLEPQIQKVVAFQPSSQKASQGSRKDRA